MTVLVTGASGLIGRFVVKNLVERGEDVVSIDVKAPAVPRVRETFEQADIGDPVTWFRLLEKHAPTAVIHLGAVITHVSYQNPVEALRVNVMGTGYLFEAARVLNRPRIVYASSVGVYGPPKLYDRIVNEDSLVGPANVYGATKVMKEAVAAHYRKAHGIESTGMRPTLAYGPGRYEGALGEINTAIRNAVTGKPVTWNQVWTDDCVHNPIHVTDIGRAFALAAVGPLLPSPVYNIGGTEALSEKEMIDIILATAPNHGTFTKAPTPVDYLVTYKQADCGKFHREANFKPTLSFADAVKWADRFYNDDTFRAGVEQ